MSGTPVVERADTAVSTAPTDAPEADGTLGRDSTTPVLAAVRRGDTTGLGHTCAPPATARVVDGLLAGVVPRCGGITPWPRAAAVPGLRHPEWFHDHVRTERLLCDGALDPGGGITPGADGAPGPGPTPGTERAQTCRVA